MAMIINGVRFNSPKLTEESVEWLKNNYHLKITEIEEHMGISDETIYRLLNALGIKRERHYARLLPNTPEVLLKLANPYLSHVKIAEEYGVHETTVQHRRKAMGISVRRNVTNNRLEQYVQDILDELDLAYIPQKKLGGIWSIDFYLGRKYCIDVHGEEIHSKPEVQDRDKRKTKWLQENGYKYLVIHERELQNAKVLIQDFTLGFPPQ
jgi:very-short-patch-repair endonuclease